MPPIDNQALAEYCLYTAHSSVEKLSMRRRTSKASVVSRPCLRARIRNWLVLTISANRGGGHVRKGYVLLPYRSSMKSSWSRCHCAVVNSDAGHVVFPITARLVGS